MCVNKIFHTWESSDFVKGLGDLKICMDDGASMHVVLT